MSPPLSSFLNRKDKEDQQKKKVAQESEGEVKVSPPPSSFVNRQEIRNIVQELNVQYCPKKSEQPKSHLSVMRELC